MLRVLRIEGLIPFTVSAILLPFVVTLGESGFSGANWGVFTLAAVAAFPLLHMDGLPHTQTRLSPDRRRARTLLEAKEDGGGRRVVLLSRRYDGDGMDPRSRQSQQLLLIHSKYG